MCSSSIWRGCRLESIRGVYIGFYIGIHGWYVHFIVVAFFNLAQMTLFPLGGHTLVAKDFVGPDVEDDEVRQDLQRKRKAIVFSCAKLFRRLKGTSSPGNRAEDDVEEKADDTKREAVDSSESRFVAPSPSRPALNSSKHVSFYLDDGISTVVATEPMISRICSPATTEAMPSRLTSPSPTHVESTKNQLENTLPKPSSPIILRQPSLLHRMKNATLPFIRSLLSPASLSIILSFPIALITPLKALFVAVDNSPIPNGPDGLPPLSFLLDTATFIGGASVPLGLICLGSALARLKIPRGQWGSLPLGAISALAVGKMVISPIVGVLICQGLTKAGLIDENDKVLRFVCMCVYLFL